MSIQVERPGAGGRTRSAYAREHPSRASGSRWAQIRTAGAMRARSARAVRRVHSASCRYAVATPSAGRSGLSMMASPATRVRYAWALTARSSNLFDEADLTPGSFRGADRQLKHADARSSGSGIVSILKQSKVGFARYLGAHGKNRNHPLRVVRSLCQCAGSRRHVRAAMLCAGGVMSIFLLVRLRCRSRHAPPIGSIAASPRRLSLAKRRCCRPGGAGAVVDQLRRSATLAASSTGHWPVTTTCRSTGTAARRLRCSIGARARIAADTERQRHGQPLRNGDRHRL